MRHCVFSLLLSSALLASLAPLACGGESTAPPREPPVQPLIIGTSPPSAPIATSPDEAPRAAAADVPEPPATGTLAIPGRDLRVGSRRPRGRALLVVELQQLERLFAVTQASAPDRAALARRLAETYAELALVSDPAGAASAHASSLKYYDVITTSYPQDPRIDEALYYHALESELAGDAKQARRFYFELIKVAPQSKLVPLAYFAFGEMFNREAVSDPSKNDLAWQAYKEVLRYPPPGNTVYADAQRRLVEVDARRTGKLTPP